MPKGKTYKGKLKENHELLKHYFGERRYPGTLTLPDIYREVALVADLSLEEAKLAVDAIFSTIADGLRRWETVMIRRFGTFIPHLNPPRSYGNPNRGGITTFPARLWPKFQCHGKLFKAINPDDPRKRPGARLYYKDRH